MMIRVENILAIRNLLCSQELILGELGRLSYEQSAGKQVEYKHVGE